MNLLLNEQTKRQLDQAANSAGGYIFYGQAGVGKMSAALAVVKRLNCLSKLNPGADNCARCGQIDAGSFPDLILVGPEEAASIGVAIIRELTQKMSTRPYYNDSVRFLIIDQAELLTPASQNALLKLIEEPPPRTRVILVSLSLESLLPTVRSRLSAVYFPALADRVVAAWLTAEQGVKSVDAAVIVKLAAGAPGLALDLSADPKAVETLKHRVDQAAGLRAPRLYNRLRAARELADDKADMFGLAGIIQEQVKSDLEFGIIESDAAAEQLSAIADLRIMLRAGVGHRVALEKFALGVADA